MVRRTGKVINSVRGGWGPWPKLGLTAAVFVVLGCAVVAPAHAADLSIRIDIKPGSHPNAVNVANPGVIPVGLFGSATFDVSEINPGNTCLVLKGLPNCLPGSYARDKQISLVAMYGQGLMDDVVLHFDSQSTGIPPSEKRARFTLCVRGSLLDGTPFEGCSGVVVVKS